MNEKFLSGTKTVKKQTKTNKQTNKQKHMTDLSSTVAVSPEKKRKLP